MGEEDGSKLVNKQWLDSQDWLQPNKDNHFHYSRYSFGDMEVHCHAEGDDIKAWASIHIDGTLLSPNPTRHQLQKFREAFDSIAPRRTRYKKTKK